MLNSEVFASCVLRLYLFESLLFLKHSLRLYYGKKTEILVPFLLLFCVCVHVRFCVCVCVGGGVRELIPMHTTNTGNVLIR